MVVHIAVDLVSFFILSACDCILRWSLLKLYYADVQQFRWRDCHCFSNSLLTYDNFKIFSTFLGYEGS